MSRERDPAVRERRRGQIVDAARAIVARGGLDALTFSALEQELGFTRGVVTWHFRNKDEVVDALLEDAIGRLDAVATAAIRAEATFPERVRAVVREMVRGWLAGDAGTVLVSQWGRADPRAADVNAALYRRYRAWSADLVRAGVAKGAFRTDVEPDAVGAVLVALVLGIVLQARWDPAVDVEAVVEAAQDAAEAWLRAR